MTNAASQAHDRERILDCSDVETAWDSLGRIFRVPRSTIECALESHRRSRPLDDLIIDSELVACVENIAGPLPFGSPFIPRYFHATRTLYGEDVFRVVVFLVFKTGWKQSGRNSGNW
jgi:hypothetical protein